MESRFSEVMSKRTDVEQILILVRSGQEEALLMEIYKNGLLCRRDCSGKYGNGK